MSEVMTCMPFEQLMNWVLEEKKTKGTVFGQHRAYAAETDRKLNIFERNLETPIGPAAGPHTQLTQNIVASYYAGARFFELKTVQKMDGAELAACINRPCILADDEGYNCEWSTELYVPQAMGEYIKAWFILHVIAKEFDLGAQDGFQFNISVGYDLAGIKEPKVNTFIDSMMEAKDTEIFKECKQWLLDNVDKFEKVTKEDIEAIPSDICNSATISTLHGCPPNEIESIANHLFKEKHLNTFIKCNPTLLGYEFARKTMDDMGYDYMVFGDFHFKDDLQYEDAIPMFKRLQALADELNLAFGVKITNTFPVDVTRNELPSEEMYMSGKSLFPLSISLAARLSREFDGKLRIAYSGGADYYNIDRIVGCGVWPVTVATTLLKPGGYQRFTQMAEKVMADGVKEWKGIDVAALIAGGRDSNDFAAQRPNQGAVLSLRVYHDYVVVCAKDQRRQLLLCRHGLAGAGYTEEKAVAVEEISPVTDNQIVGDSIDAVVNTAFVLDLLGLERHENGGALGSQAAHGIHPLEAIGEHGIEAVLLLIFEGRDLTASPLPY